MEAARRVKAGSRFKQWKVSPFQTACHLHNSSVLLFSLFVLSAYRARAAAIDYGISPNQAFSCV